MICAEVDNTRKCANASAGDSQNLVLNSQKSPKISPKLSGNSQNYLCRDI